MHLFIGSAIIAYQRLRTGVFLSDRPLVAMFSPPYEAMRINLGDLAMLEVA